MVQCPELSCQGASSTRVTIPLIYPSPAPEAFRGLCAQAVLGLAGAGIRGCQGQWGLCAVRSPVSGAAGRHSPTSRLVGFCVGFMVWEYWRSGCISIFALCPFPKTTSLLLFVTVEFPHFSQSVVTKEIQPCFGLVSIGTGFPGLLLFVLPNCWCLAAVFSLDFSWKVKPSSCSSKF